MPVYEGTAYQTATIIVEVEEDPATGKEINPLKYLDFDRVEYRAEDYDDNVLYVCKDGDTPDSICHELYDDSTVTWIMADFNDWVAEDMFMTFEGGEILVMPSRNTFETLIRTDDGTDR